MSELYLKRIYDTQNYIEKNYDKLIAVSELEAISCYSYRNLQRIFFSLFNETIGSYQTRLKVENGYKILLYSKKQISDIAIEVGFSDLQSFSKTFKKHFGISPSVARNKKEILFRDNNFIQSIDYDLEPEIIFIPKKLVNYSSCRTNYINPEIESLWDNFLKNNFDTTNSQYFGVISDDVIITNKSKCNYDACVFAENLNPKLPVKEIFGSKYAKFIHNGSYNSIEKIYAQIYGGWILDNELEFSHLPIIENYIKHDSNASSESDFITEILIPLL
ncbi:GyrI-like domain-containing protein [Flavobacterium sp.]|uniref:AraC family transcriptional regulator n=1 Tax=Flavobacterium sp. TaxID=239 RepID=UPI00375187F7